MSFVANEHSTQLSYLHGVSMEPLIGLTIGRLFDGCVERYGDDEALVVVDQNIRWTWRELGADVNRFAAGLVGLGTRYYSSVRQEGNSSGGTSVERRAATPAGQSGQADV